MSASCECRAIALPWRSKHQFAVQELLLNACRHSKSKNVLVGLAQDDECLCVQVQDWGVGFDSESNQPHQRGLKAVRSLVARLGGTVEIYSQCGKGTCVMVELPLFRDIKPNRPRTPSVRPG